MPAGGLAELKRRKQEAEKAASGGTEKESTAPTAVAGKSAEDERPGELQHVRESFVVCIYFERLMSSSCFWHLSGFHINS